MHTWMVKHFREHPLFEEVPLKELVRKCVWPAISVVTDVAITDMIVHGSMCRGDGDCYTSMLLLARCIKVPDSGCSSWDFLRGQLQSGEVHFKTPTKISNPWSNRKRIKAIIGSLQLQDHN